MKQTVLVLALFLVGTGGAILYGPFLGVAVYYLFAVLRPQYLWEWALVINLGWSFYVALATFVAILLHSSGGFCGKIFSTTHATLLGFAAWVSLSHLFALNIDVSSRWYWEYMKIFVMFFCSSLVVRDLIQVRVLYLIAVWSLGYIAYEMNALYVFSGRLDIYHEGYGGLDNNGAGLMIAMGVPLAYFLWQGSRQWSRWIYLAMIPVMVHAVLMSYSRGAMVSLLLTSPLLILRSRRKTQLIFAILLFSWVVPILAGQEIRARFFSVETYETDSSSQSRLDSWNAAWQIAKDHPLTGVGLRNADLLSFQYGADLAGRTIHSQYLQILADSGFPALGLYLLLYWGAWKTLRRSQKHFRQSASQDDQVAYNLAAGVEGAIVVFAIGSIFLSLEVFELPYLLLLLAARLGLAINEAKVPVASVRVVPQFAGTA
jgi:probable O-glycosylation ligase (exosortase A-associated)